MSNNNFCRRVRPGDKIILSLGADKIEIEFVVGWNIISAKGFMMPADTPLSRDCSLTAADGTVIAAKFRTMKNGSLRMTAMSPQPIEANFAFSDDWKKNKKKLQSEKKSV